MSDLLDHVLAEAVDLGFLSARPAVDHRRHAEVFVGLVDGDGPIVDLGTGGGVPGLVVAAALPDRPVLMIERGARRAAFLEGAAARLGLPLATVVTGAAETAALDHRGVATAVTARSFGPPPVVAECGVPFLATDGRLVVSEPPGGDSDRWPAEALAALGLSPARIADGPPAMAVMVRVGEAAMPLPRPPGTARRRPLF